MSMIILTLVSSSSEHAYEHELGRFGRDEAIEFLSNFSGFEAEHVAEVYVDHLRSDVWVDEVGAERPNRRSFKWMGGNGVCLEITMELAPVPTDNERFLSHHPPGGPA